MLIQTDTLAYVIHFKEDGSCKSWVWDNLPEGTTHIPLTQHLNSRYYKLVDGKWYRWSSSHPCWDFCGGSGKNLIKL